MPFLQGHSITKGMKNRAKELTPITINGETKLKTILNNEGITCSILSRWINRLNAIEIKQDVIIRIHNGQTCDRTTAVYIVDTLNEYHNMMKKEKDFHTVEEIFTKTV